MGMLFLHSHYFVSICKKIKVIPEMPGPDLAMLAVLFFIYFIIIYY